MGLGEQPLRVRAARKAAAWGVAAGGLVGAPLALAAGKPALAVAFHAATHSCLTQVVRARADALVALAWAACAAASIAPSAGFSSRALQLAPPLAAYAHARSVNTLRKEVPGSLFSTRVWVVIPSQTVALNQILGENGRRDGDPHAQNVVDGAANRDLCGRAVAGNDG